MIVFTKQHIHCLQAFKIPPPTSATRISYYHGNTLKWIPIIIFGWVMKELTECDSQCSCVEGLAAHFNTFSTLSIYTLYVFTTYSPQIIPHHLSPTDHPSPLYMHPPSTYPLQIIPHLYICIHHLPTPYRSPLTFIYASTIYLPPTDHPSPLYMHPPSTYPLQVMPHLYIHPPPIAYRSSFIFMCIHHLSPTDSPSPLYVSTTYLL